MKYAVVINYNETNKICLVAVVDDIDYRQVFMVQQISEGVLASWCLKYNYLPFNFSIKTDNGKPVVEQDCGVFTRFDKASGVILAKLIMDNKTAGFRIITKNGALMDITYRKLTHEDILIQNAIKRQGVINSYPNYPFATIKQTTKKVTTVSQEQKPNNEQAFSREQIFEIKSARENGIETRDLIENPKLKPKQMRILWVARKNGSLSENFKDPHYSPEVMKFYADRIFNESSLNICEPLLANPKLTVDQLTELYLCRLQAIPIDKIMNKTAEEIRLHRQKNTITVVSNADIIDDAMRVAMKLQQ